jgi:colanic acid/amylovoran biosynthesis glycosyltransferase
VGDGRRPVVIYRETLVQASEPFIPAQAERLARHEPWYLGLRSVDAHPLPETRDLRWRGGRFAPVRRYAWKRWGLSPATHRELRRIDPVVLHAHFGRDAAQVLPALRRHPLPLIVTFHGHDAMRSDQSLRDGSFSDRLYLDRFQQLSATASRLLAVSCAVRDRLRDRGAPDDKLEVHYLGVPTVEIAAIADGPREAGLVVFVGRLVAQKGADDLIRAMATVCVTRPDAHLVIIGDGPERTALERLGEGLRVPVTFLGARSQDEVWKWMGRALAVAVPSRTGADGACEAFGLVAAEAQAAGSVVVASSSGGLPEAIAPPNERFLFTEGDVEALSQRLVDALSSDGVERRAHEARRWVAQHRDLPTQTARLDDLYEEVAP